MKCKECGYCKATPIFEIRGTEFELKPTAGFKNDRKYSAWIMKGQADEKAAIMISTNGGNAVYFDINYCPRCGRKLGD